MSRQTDTFGSRIRKGLTRWLAADTATTSGRKRLSNRVAGPSQLDQYGTYPAAGLTPAGLTEILKSADQGDILKQSELFAQIEEKDTRIQGNLQTRRQAVASLNWEVQPASSDQKDIDIALDVTGMLNDIGTYRSDEPNIISDGFDVALADMLDAIGKGFSALEIMYKQLGDATLVPTELRWVPQTRFTYWDTNIISNRLQFGGMPRLLTDDEPQSGIDLPEYKFVVHRAHHRAGYPSKAGLIRTLCWFYLFKNYGIKDWAVMLERYSSPFRVGKYPQGASPTVISELEDAMAKLGVDAYAVMHEDAQIEFINALQGDAIHGKSFIEYMDREISIAVLGHAGASEGTPGKLGNENMAGDLRQDLLEADAKQLMATINSQLVRYYVELNYGMDLSLPKFKLNFEPPADLQAEADKDSKILSLGLSTSKKHLRDKYNLPEPEDDEDEFAVVQSATAPPLSAHDQRHALLASDTARRQVKTVDDLNAARKKKVIAPFAESPKSSKASSVSGHHMGLRPRS